MNQVVRPQNRREFMNKLIVPYDKSEGNKNTVFSEPTKLGQPEKNRAKQISVKTSTDKDFYIGMKDFVEAVMYYFDNVLKLSVVQNNNRVPVPILYGSPENWKTVQKDGYYRDKDGKLFAPLIMFKRSSTTPNRNLGNKLDGNSVHNLQLFEKAYSKRNFYSNFNVLNSRSPEKEYIASITPDYVTVEYECMIWTYTVEQMDKLIEALNFASRSYWGDPNRFQFYSQIEAFSDSLTYEVGEDRAVKSSFNLTLNGYLIPDSINKSLANANIYYGVSNVIFTLETATSTESITVATSNPSTVTLAGIVASDGQNVVVNNNYSSGDPASIAYMVNQKEVLGTYVSSTTVNFAKGWAVAPVGVPVNNASNFTFFVNGQFVEPAAIVSFTDYGSSSTLIIDPAQLGYSLDTTDTIVGVGKFN
jgi:hypothetical protein